MSFTDQIRRFATAIDERFHLTRRSSTERGRRGTEESQLRAIYERLQPSWELHATINEIRRMDKADGHVKEIHSKTAKGLTKGGLQLDNPTNHKRLNRAWNQFSARCNLNNRLKLISDAQGLVKEGSLPMQWVLSTDGTQVVRCIRMPTETIRPIVGVDGQFEDPKKAYAQHNFLEGRDIAHFACWQMDVARLDPENFDDMGALGRPMLDANRKRWRQIMMGLDDAAIRRHTRAAMRTAHFLEGADNPALAEYKKTVESEEAAGLTHNYYSNKKGAVTAVQGDANLDQIQDLAMLFDSFFAGTPMPKALLGYVNDLNRDVLMDMKQEWFEELDTLQDALAGSYEHGFRLQLLLMGINPENIPWKVQYGERLTETLSQRTDRALKLMPMGASQHTVWKVAGLDPNAERDRVEEQRKDSHFNPYPDSDVDLPGVNDSQPNPQKQEVKITPDQGGKGQSATSISHG